MKQLEGTGVALVTPFNRKLEIDFPSLKRLINHTAKGVDYYVVMGTTGESVTVTAEEKKAVLRFVKENNSAKLPVVYGIGGNNTQAVLDTIRSTEFKGVDAVLSVSPYYNKPSQEGIVQHFKAIADACPVPVILYNVPGRTSSNLSAETTLRLAKHPNIIGIKEASGNLEQCMKISKHMPRNFLLISGDDLLTVPLYSIGARGVISVLANAFPVVFKQMKESVFTGDYRSAQTALFKLLEINGPMYEEGNPVGVKQVLQELAICKNSVRLPLVPASLGLQKKIQAILQASKMKKG
ncbi:4-hydroxy-tetrahydrodipicolinate synthase [Oscillatoria amoena NRMC-F 0135]|nr:4-hydroxy-tetrahydrodipicolinate synthase [Oscillatoria amoena NRMC-F 0135]